MNGYATESRIGNLKSLARRMEAEEVCLEHNEGTFGAQECLRAIGTGETKRGEYTIWERVGGGRRVEGCDPERAPGRPRRNPDAGQQLAHKRAVLRELRVQIRQLEQQG